MKKFLLCIMVTMLTSSLMYAQPSGGGLTSACDLYDILVQNIKNVDTDPNDGKCYVTFNLAFTLAANQGSKYIFLQTYIDSVVRDGVVNTQPPHNYPNYFNCQNGLTSEKKPPMASDAGDPLLNIAIDNSGDIPFFTEYTPDPTLDTVGATSSSTITKVTLANGDTRFLLTDILVILPYECGSGTQYMFVTDVFATNAANANTLHCVNCGRRTSGGATTVDGRTSCNLATGTITNLTNEPVTVTYELYADNGDGVLATENSADVLFVTNTVTIDANGTYNFSASLPPALAGRDVFIVVNIGDARRASPLPTIECSPLPVNMHSFSANRAGASVNLKWSTATELNSRGFDLQREIGNNVWESIAFIPSKAVNGNSDMLLTYTYTDLNNAPGISNYRLRQVDMDGTMRFSAVRSVRGIAQTSEIIVYPNPSNTGTVNVLLDNGIEARDLMLMDIAGRMLRQWNNITDNNLQITNLVQGVYNLKIINRSTGQVVNKKLIVNK